MATLLLGGGFSAFVTRSHVNASTASNLQSVSANNKVTQSILLNETQLPPVSASSFQSKQIQLPPSQKTAISSQIGALASSTSNDGALEFRHPASSKLSYASESPASLPNYDEQIGETFTQSFTSMAYNVTAVAQVDSDNFGPGYLLNGLSDTGYWYQVGLSYNWPSVPSISGFYFNYEVFDPNGNSIFPTNGEGGLLSFSGPVNAGDNVLLNLYYGTGSYSGQVVMLAIDYTTGARAFQTYSSEGGSQFVGNSVSTANSQGFFTGLMTEQYHYGSYYGGEERVVYSNPSLPLASAAMWIDEYNANTSSVLFAGTYGIARYTSQNQFQTYSLDGATESSDAYDLTTGGQAPVALTMSYKIVGGGFGYSPPTLSFSSGGQHLTTTLSESPTVYDVDLGSSWSVTNILSGSGSDERWITSEITSGTANSAEIFSFLYNNQFRVTFDANPVGEGSASPSGSGWYNSGQSYSVIATAVSPYFLTSWTSTPGLIIADPSSASTKVSIGGSGTVTANFGQLLVTLDAKSGAVTQGSSILLSGVAKGVGTGTISVSGLLEGETSTLANNTIALAPTGTEFSLKIGTNHNVTTGASTISVILTETGVGSTSSQFVLTVKQAEAIDIGYSVVGDGSGFSSPILSYTYNGTATQSTLSNTSTVIYVDQNTNWSVPEGLAGSSSSERWETNQTTSGMASSAVTVNLVYYHQYLVSFNYTVADGYGRYAPPSVAAIQFGSSISPALGQQIWVDAASKYSYTNPLPGSTSIERWITSNSTGSVRSGGAVSLSYDHQYYLDFRSNPISAGLISLSSGWYDAGSNIVLSANATSGWQFEGWVGHGNNSYNGQTASQTIGVSSQFNETAEFYVGVTITSSPGGSTSYSDGSIAGTVSSGSSATVYVPPSSTLDLSESPASSLLYQFNGWSGASSASNSVISVNATTPSTVEAEFGYNIVFIGLSGGAVVVIVALAFFVISRRKKISNPA